jgi:predicted RNase H-like HicB family nuclease
MRDFILYEDNSGEWVAECREIPGYRARGRTKEEAIEKIKAALLVFYPCKCEDEPGHQ